VERKTNGDESENACAWDAAQASNVVAVENFMIVVVVVMPARSSALAAASWLRLRLGREPGASGWLGWMMQPTAEWGGGGWQKPR
jgi:hypothetical protein